MQRDSADIAAGEDRPRLTGREQGQTVRRLGLACAAVAVAIGSSGGSDLRAQLEGWGMEVVDHGDPREALLEVLTEGLEADIAVLDMHMPGMDGAALAKGLREAHGWGRVPLVLLTSLGEKVEAVRALEMLQLTKPVKAAALRDALADALGAASSPRRGRAAGDASDLAPLRLLVAEDNEVNQIVAEGILKALGYDCDIAADGQETLEALERTAYAAVLMDCQMPVMDGFEATAAIKAEGHSVAPIIAMTAGGNQADRDRCSNVGMDDFVPKPVKTKELEEALRRWITRAQEAQAVLPACASS